MRGWITLIVFFLVAAWLGDRFPAVNLIGKVFPSSDDS